MANNKIKFGLKNVYYSVITLVNNVPNYGTPVAVPGAVNLTLDPEGEKITFYADDSAYFVQTANSGYTGSLEIALIPDSFKKDVLGEIEDDNGALIENADVTTKDFALMFEFNGDANATRHVLYNVNAARPSVAGATKGASIEAQTETLEITASPAVDTKHVKAKLNYGQTGYNTFYSAVYLENAVTNTAAAATVSFSKAAAADVAINVTSSDAQNELKNVYNNGTPVGNVNFKSISGVDVTIAKEYFSALDNGVYVISLEFNTGNALTVTVTVAA